MTAIRFEQVWKSYSRARGRMLLRNLLAQRASRGERGCIHAMKNVSFSIEPGGTVALVGANGAGKSTLLGLVAGVNWPTAGRVSVTGRVAALLELGSGFHPDLTGAENLRLNASLLGFKRNRVQEVYESIIEFSGLGDLIDEPLRAYSTGMVMRLAFSVAVNTDPDILLVDEVLAVGDQSFQAKCIDRIVELKRSGKTMLCVSHSSSVLQQFCERALWLDHGELIMDGNTQEVLEAYAGHARNTTPRGV